MILVAFRKSLNFKKNKILSTYYIIVTIHLFLIVIIILCKIEINVLNSLSFDYIFCLETKETKIQDFINFWKQLLLVTLYFRKVLYY